MAEVLLALILIGLNLYMTKKIGTIKYDFKRGSDSGFLRERYR